MFTLIGAAVDVILIGGLCILGLAIIIKVIRKVAEFIDLSG